MRRISPSKSGIARHEHLAMTDRSGAALVGYGLGLVVATLTMRLLLRLAGSSSHAMAATPRADEVLSTLLCWVGITLAGWLAVGSALGLLSLLPGALGQVASEATDRVTPVVVRRALTLVLGASVGSVAVSAGAFSVAVTAATSSDDASVGGGARSVGGGARSVGDGADSNGGDIRAHSAPDDLRGFSQSRVPLSGVPMSGVPLRHGDDTSVVVQPSLSPAFVPVTSRAAESHATPAFTPSAPAPTLSEDRSRLLVPSPRISSATHDLVTVRRGDTLWSIARRHLGPEATDSQVAHEWPRWHAANRALIGDDPSRILPGQQLQPPARATHAGPIGPVGPSPAFAPTDAGTSAASSGRGGPR
jgi:LysM repeat protein